VTWGNRTTWVLSVLAAVVLAFLYTPLVPPIISSLRPEGGSGVSLDAYTSLYDDPIVPDALQTTIVSAVITALVAMLLGLLGAMAVRELRVSRGILALLLAPLFIPGVSMGLADAFFFHELGIEPSLLTIVAVQVLWCLPFAVLIVLTTMSTFDPIYLEAAYVHGADRLRAFRDIELPQIAPGLIGAALFSFILSINETVRTQLVQGPLNNIQTYIYSTYLQVGLNPSIYALMSLLIIVSVLLFLLLLVRSLVVRTHPAAQ
jgi:spermidine/putrescine transport system permease protein